MEKSDSKTLETPLPEPIAPEVLVVETADDLIRTIIDTTDDPSESPWTIRMFIIGIILTIFGSVIQQIFYFKPQVVVVNNIFFVVIAQIMGQVMSKIPLTIFGDNAVGKKICRAINPGKFNIKEHASITMMATSGAVSSLAIEALAAQELFYGGYPNRVAGIFVVIASQTIGYGFAGLMRNVLVYPTACLYPDVLPVTTLLENFHRGKEVQSKMKVFYIVFFAIMVWEIVPQWMFPLLAGISVFCLANQNSLVFTYLFGGLSGNEGLGLFSWSFDWNSISNGINPLALPLRTLVNSCIGYYLGIIILTGLYWGNVWEAKKFPFMSQLLFSDASDGTQFVKYNQTAIMDGFQIDPVKLAEQGAPSITATYIAYLMFTNMSFTTTIVYMLLWHWNDFKHSLDFLHPRSLRMLGDVETYKFWKQVDRTDELSEDPHRRLVQLNYRECPNSWYALTALASVVVGLVSLSALNSTLPWWGFLVACLMTVFSILIFGRQKAITGWELNLKPVSQVLAGHMFPNLPLANMYFTTFGYNAVFQGISLLKDLKLAQYVHLSPKAAYTVQMLGCVIGAMFNYIIMISIVQNKRDILLSIEGTNIWSGSIVQHLNSMSVSWSISSREFDVGAKYSIVSWAFLIGLFLPLPLWLGHRFYPRYAIWSYIDLPIIIWYCGFLFIGINSGIMTYFIIGFASQFYIRRYHPKLFIKYNYLLSAALDGGTQICTFILTFAVFGGSGNSVDFPIWAGNNGGGSVSGKNLDFCLWKSSH